MLGVKYLAKMKRVFPGQGKRSPIRRLNCLIFRAIKTSIIFKSGPLYSAVFLIIIDLTCTTRSLRKLKCWHTDIDEDGLKVLAGCTLLKKIKNCKT